MVQCEADYFLDGAWQAASFSWDQVDMKRKEGEPYKASGPQSGLHPYDVDGWPEMERRKAMFEGNSCAQCHQEDGMSAQSGFDVRSRLRFSGVFVFRARHVCPCSRTGQDPKAT